MPFQPSPFLDPLDILVDCSMAMMVLDGQERSFEVPELRRSSTIPSEWSQASRVRSSPSKRLMLIRALTALTVLPSRWTCSDTCTRPYVCPRNFVDTLNCCSLQVVRGCRLHRSSSIPSLSFVTFFFMLGCRCCNLCYHKAIMGASDRRSSDPTALTSSLYGTHPSPRLLSLVRSRSAGPLIISFFSVLASILFFLSPHGSPESHVGASHIEHHSIGQTSNAPAASRWHDRIAHVFSDTLRHSFRVPSTAVSCESIPSTLPRQFRLELCHLPSRCNEGFLRIVQLDPTPCRPPPTSAHPSRIGDADDQTAADGRSSSIWSLGPDTFRFAITGRIRASSESRPSDVRFIPSYRLSSSEDPAEIEETCAYEFPFELGRVGGKGKIGVSLEWYLRDWQDRLEDEDDPNGWKYLLVRPLLIPAPLSADSESCRVIVPPSSTTANLPTHCRPRYFFRPSPSALRPPTGPSKPFPVASPTVLPPLCPHITVSRLAPASTHSSLHLHLFFLRIWECRSSKATSSLRRSKIEARPTEGTRSGLEGVGGEKSRLWRWRRKR